MDSLGLFWTFFWTSSRRKKEEHNSPLLDLLASPQVKSGKKFREWGRKVPKMGLGHFFRHNLSYGTPFHSNFFRLRPNLCHSLGWALLRLSLYTFFLTWHKCPLCVHLHPYVWTFYGQLNKYGHFLDTLWTYFVHILDLDIFWMHFGRILDTSWNIVSKMCPSPHRRPVPRN